MRRRAMLGARKRRRSAEAGFTIVELLVAVAIIGVITIPLSNVVISILRNQQATSARLELSHDAQIAGAYFAADVATLGVRNYTDPTPTGGNIAFNPSFYVGASGPACGPSPSVLKILSDHWEGGSATTDVVSYYVNGTELRRVKCENGSTTSNVALAHHVKTVAAPTCSPSCSDNAPRTVELALTVATAQADDYTFTLSGQRRQT